MRKNERGIALILAITVITMVSLLLTAYVAMTISERKRIEHETAGASAEYIAKAGLEQAFFDLSSEYEKDKSWIDGGVSNTINGINASVPAINQATNQSAYQIFYNLTPFPDAASGNYTVNISFVNNADDTAFLLNKLWVRSTGIVAATNDSITLTQLARNMPVAWVTTAPFAINKTYDYLDQAGNSAVINCTSAAGNDEIRIAPAIVDGKVAINDAGDLIIRGGYDFDFSNSSRNADEHQSILNATAGDPVVNITGTGTVTMGGVRIE